jgi:CheY-like chemotaxis protein
MKSPRDCINIVIADDDEDDQFICREALKRTHFTYNISAVYNGAQLLDLLGSPAETSGYSRPDFIILDINMPVVDGLSALQKIKSESGLRDIPVFILSTTDRAEHVIKAKQLGVQKYYRKPNGMDGFEKIMNEIITVL